MTVRRRKMEPSSTASYTNLASTEDEIDDFILVLTTEESRALQEAVDDALHDLYCESQLFDAKRKKSETLPVLQKPLALGEKLGEGGFCQVYAYNEDDDDDDEGGGNADRVIKLLSHNDSTRRTIGTMDLVREAHFLAALQHDNIIRIHGMGSDRENAEDFFIVLDRLEQTLGSVTRGSGITTKPELLQRLKWGLQIARALKYLHSNNVIYRDLKMSNIGLDGDGVIKLFDFGLAKELRPSREENGKYKLSGKTGSYRSMAPEVSKNWMYNEKVDVYSFGILLWEILSGEVAFAHMTEEQYLNMVANGQERPRLKLEWPSEVKDLIQRCWSFFPNARPSMLVVESGLSFMVSQVQLEIDRERENNMRILRRAAVLVMLICVICWYLLLHQNATFSYRL